MKKIFLCLILILISIIMPVSATFTTSWGTSPINEAGNVSPGSTFPNEPDHNQYCSDAGGTTENNNWYYISTQPGTDTAFYQHTPDTIYYGTNVNYAVTVPTNINGSWIFQRVFCNPAGAWYIAHVYKIGPTSVAPIANFTNVAYPKNCYYENEGLDFLDLSENEPDEWFWEIYDNSTSVSVWNSVEQSPLWLVDGDPGWYDVQLTVENSAGTGFLYKPHFFKIGDPGECTYEPITNITTQPTIQLVPTGVPNVINSTVWKESFGVMGFCNSSMGGACQYYFNTTDMFADVVNGTFSNIVGIFTSPLDWVSRSVESVDSDIQTLVTPLIEQSSIFLGIMTRAFIALPAVMVNIVTLGLLIDIVRIVLKGRGD